MNKQQLRPQKIPSAITQVLTQMFLHFLNMQSSPRETVTLFLLNGYAELCMGKTTYSEPQATDKALVVSDVSSFIIWLSSGIHHATGGACHVAKVFLTQILTTKVDTCSIKYNKIHSKISKKNTQKPCFTNTLSLNKENHDVGMFGYLTPQSSSKILRYTSYFQLSSWCLETWSNTIFPVWYEMRTRIKQPSIP